MSKWKQEQHRLKKAEHNVSICVTVLMFEFPPEGWGDVNSGEVESGWAVIIIR